MAIKQDDQEHEYEYEYETEDIKPDLSDDLAEVLADLGGEENTQVNVSKVGKNNKKEFVGTYSPDEFSLSMLQDLYGGGEYVILGRRSNRIAFNRKVSIAEPIKPTVPAYSQNDNLAAVLEAGFKQQNEAMNKFMMMMIGMKQTANPVDPQSIKTSLLEDLQMMKDLIGGNNNQQALGPEKMLDLLKTGIEFGKEAGGGETGVLDILAKSLETFGKPVAAALEQDQLMKAKALERQQRIAAKKRAAQKQQETGPDPEAGNEQETNNMFKRYIGFLVQQAQTGSDPLLYADLILDQVPESELIAFLQQGDPVETLGKLDNNVIVYQEWFTALGEELKNQLGLLPDPSADVSEPSKESENSDAPSTVIEGQIEDNGDTGTDPER